MAAPKIPTSPDEPPPRYPGARIVGLLLALATLAGLLLGFPSQLWEARAALRDWFAEDHRCGIFFTDRFRVPRTDVALDTDRGSFDRFAKNGKLLVPCDLHGKRARIQDQTFRIVDEIVINFDRGTTMTHRMK